MSWMALFLMSSKSQAYCRTASAVPWNHSLSVGVCVAASTSTKPSPPNLTPLQVAAHKLALVLTMHCVTEGVADCKNCSLTAN